MTGLREAVPTTEAERRGLLLGVLVPPLAWLARLQLTYWLVALGCARGRSMVPALLGTDALALLLCAACGAFAGRSWRRASTAPLSGAIEGVEGARMLAVLGLVVSAAFAVVLVASAIPTLMLNPCD